MTALMIFFFSLSLYLQGNNVQWPWSRPLTRFFALHKIFPQIEIRTKYTREKSLKKVKQKEKKLSYFFPQVDSNRYLNIFWTARAYKLHRVTETDEQR